MRWSLTLSTNFRFFISCSSFSLSNSLILSWCFFKASSSKMSKPSYFLESSCLLRLSSFYWSLSNLASYFFLLSISSCSFFRGSNLSTPFSFYYLTSSMFFYLTSSAWSFYFFLFNSNSSFYFKAFCFSSKRASWAFLIRSLVKSPNFP